MATDTTFFGEVHELRSRAVWSDSEEDDVQGDGPEVLPAPVIKKVGADCRAFSIVYITSGKLVNCVKDKKAATTFEEANGTKFAQIFAIGNEKSAWLVVNDVGVETDFQLARRGRTLATALIGETGPDTHFVIVSRVASKISDVQFLSNRTVSVVPLSKSLLLHSLRAPDMVSDILESSIMSQLIASNRGVTWISLPDERVAEFDAKTTTLPVEIVGAMKRNNQLTADNNMYA